MSLYWVEGARSEEFNNRSQLSLEVILKKNHDDRKFLAILFFSVIAEYGKDYCRGSEQKIPSHQGLFLFHPHFSN